MYKQTHIELIDVSRRCKFVSDGIIYWNKGEFLEIREKITDREVKYTGRIIEVEKVTAVLPNGKVVYRDVVRHNGETGIVA